MVQTNRKPINQQDMDLTILSCIQLSDVIAILDIIITIVIAVWIGVFIQRNFTTVRAVKEYFISENQEIRNNYNTFLDGLYTGNAKANQVQEWFKIMTMRIDIYEDFLKKEFSVHPKMSKHHTRIKILITGSDELNENYKSDSFTLLTPTKMDLHKIHKDFTIAQTKLVVEINKAKNNRGKSTK